MKIFILTLVLTVTFVWAQTPDPTEKDSALWAFDSTNMVLIQGGTFRMGSMDGKNFEGPIHDVLVRPFYVDKYEVTNREFKKFADETGYVTTAEKNGTSWCYSNGGWVEVDSACWRRPDGLGSSLRGRWDSPVVHMSWFDAREYAKWANKRLPTEAEWEKAARGGVFQQSFTWGPEWDPKKANVRDYEKLTVMKIGSFKPNQFGLYDMIGNAWEWCNDWFSKYYYRNSAIIDPQGPAGGSYKVMRGGGFASHEGNAQVFHRQAHETTRTASDFGFRCVAP